MPNIKQTPCPISAPAERAPNMREFTLNSAYAQYLLGPPPCLLPTFPRARQPPVIPDEQEGS